MIRRFSSDTQLQMPCITMASKAGRSSRAIRAANESSDRRTPLPVASATTWAFATWAGLMSKPLKSPALAAAWMFSATPCPNPSSR